MGCRLRERPLGAAACTPRTGPRGGLPVHEIFWLPPVSALLDPRAGLRVRRVLDVGFHDGGSLERLAEALEPSGVFAVDPDVSGVPGALERFGNAGGTAPCFFARCRAEALPFADGVFDVVFCRSVLQYADGPVAIGEMRRVLSPGGSLLVIANMSSNPFVRLYRSLRRDDRCSGARVKGYLSLRDIEVMVRSGVCRSHSEHHLLSPLLFPLLTALPRCRARSTAASAAFRLDAILLAVFPALRRMAWVSAMELAP